MRRNPNCVDPLGVGPASRQSPRPQPDEIAASLILSRHTVRDPLKAIFEKVSVSSRGELTSKLFAEHYHPHAHATMDRSSKDRLADRLRAVA